VSDQEPFDVFEHGVVVGGEDHPSGLGRVATTRLPIWSGYTITIVDRDGSSLNHRANHLVNVPGPYETSDLWDENNVTYCVRSALYRVDRIIRMYMDQCQLFEEHESDAKITQGNTSDPRVYFEVDAFLGDARRVYDSISKVLWKHYVGNAQGRWRSIRKLVESETALATIPAEFSQPLKQSWDAFGIKLTDYRDFVMHIAPLAGEGATWMNRWGATVGLPTDPTAKSWEVYDNVQGAGIDALKYCHGMATHLIGLCEQLMALPAVEAHIVNPSPHKYSLRERPSTPPQPLLIHVWLCGPLRPPER
jgi:hypothetical protein